MLMRSWRTVTLLSWLIALGSWSPALAQDWNQWRGPNRDGIASPSGLPSSWPEALRPGWKVTVGVGHSSPVVVGNRVIVFARQEEREVVQCLDLATGKVVWQDAYDAPYTVNSAARAHGPGPKSTPAVANGKLYTFGMTAILSCYDVGSGRLVWRKSFADQFRNTSPADVGMYMNSPILSGDRLYGLSHKNRGQFFCLEAGSGRTVWLGEARQGDNAAMLLAGAFVVSLTSDADLVVSKAGPGGLELVRKYKAADSPTWAHPVLVGRRLLVKDATTLALWAIE